MGRITAAHGVRGEVNVEPLTAFPERFEAGSRLWLDGSPLTVEQGRWRRRSVILKLKGIDTRTQAEAIAGKELLVPQATPLEAEDVYYLHDILGLRVEDAAGEALGEVVEVLSTGSNDVYVVRGERGEILLPALDDVVREINLTQRRIVVEVPDGLEFVQRAAPRGRAPRRKPAV